MLSPGSFALDFHRSRDTTMGTAWERTPWHAAAWEAWTKSAEDTR
jgi:hypothetical protein